MTENATPQLPFFKAPRPTAIRVWHWLVFLFFLMSITTVIFGSTLFKTKPNVAMVQEQVTQKGGILTEKQAWGVAHEYSDKLWMLHKYLGYGLALLLLWRMIIEFQLSKEKKLFTRIRAAAQYPGNSPEKQHYKMVQYLYLFFYGIFLLMALTGLVLAYEDLDFLRPVHEAAEEIHGLAQYGMYGFIIFHIIGVIRADLGAYSGLVSSMINGK
jgi:Ni/Fe-hydrogenase 1 B-type cytochrome subunit